MNPLVYYGNIATSHTFTQLTTARICFDILNHSMNTPLKLFYSTPLFFKRTQQRYFCAHTYTMSLKTIKDGHHYQESSCSSGRLLLISPEIMSTNALWFHLWSRFDLTL